MYQTWAFAVWAFWKTHKGKLISNLLFNICINNNYKAITVVYYWIESENSVIKLQWVNKFCTELSIFCTDVYKKPPMLSAYQKWVILLFMLFFQ